MQYLNSYLQTVICIVICLVKSDILYMCIIGIQINIQKNFMIS